jgi:L-asparaginase
LPFAFCILPFALQLSSSFQSLRPVSSPMPKRVYLAATGGTIGMDTGPDGYVPRPGFLQEQMHAMPELRTPSMPEYVLREYDPLLDSANMTPAGWLRIARDIADNYDAFDGFVVLHGTDTMAYTASALAFLLEGLAKPVILTGSQIPLCEVRNDARLNLITSLQVAGGANIPPIPEVCVCFGSRLLRGCRVVKVSADGLEAFDSPNFPALGSCGVEIHVDWKLVRPPSGLGLIVRDLGEPYVAAMRVFPGIRAGVMANILQPPLQGLVLETYGVGNIPDRDPALLEALQAAADRGVVIVNCTQCLAGTVDMGGYATGSGLQKAGAISGRDMSAEAALAKLYYLLALGLSCDVVKEQMQRDLKGELTE